MEKKKASLITMIMLIGFTVVSAIPFVYIEKYFQSADDGGYESYPSNIWPHHMYLWNIKILSILCVILAVIGIVCMFLQYNGKEHKFSKVSNYVPIATGAVYVIMSIYVLTVTYPDDEVTDVYPKGFLGYWRFDGGFGFYLQLALMICCAVLCYSIITNNPTLLTSKGPTSESVEKSEVQKVAVPAVQSALKKESLEELVKYKDLLDNEIITKEEFEKKKKQILGTEISSFEVADKKEDVAVVGERQIQATKSENDDEVETEEVEVKDNGQI